MSSSKRSGRPSLKKTNPKFQKGKSRSEANVAGYEKRMARKGKSATSTLDLYEHIQQKERRSKVGLDVDRNEEYENAGIDDIDEDEREQLRARLIGENQDDEEIASDDDEEIDSDAAFEESDEDRFAGFFSSKKWKSKAVKKAKAKPAVRFAEVDLDEDEDIESGNEQVDVDEDSDEDEEEEEGDDDEFIDLLDVLDGKGEIDMGSDDEKAAPRKSSPKPQEESDEEALEQSGEDSEEDSEEEVSEDEKMEIEPSDEEDAPEALDQLNDFVSQLDVTAKKRKAPEEDAAAAGTSEVRARKRRQTKEKTEAGEENEFRAVSTSSKLNLEDLLAPLGDQSSTLQSLKKSTKILGPSSSSKAKTLSAPLPQRIQERLDRQAAYEQTKEEVDKWSATMKRIREAEHLSFPLQAQSTGKPSNLELNAKFKPTTEMESAVDALLRSANMREEEIQHTEDNMLKMNKLSVEEVAQRRAELRKMRELMFRAEIKARRVGKIKSKTYRRLRRKEKERLGEKIDEQESDDEAAKIKQDLDRARERATLRHKHTGKWARQMRGKEGLDEDSRRDIEEMLARGEKLRRRIKGVGSDEEEDGDSDDESSDDDGMDIDGDIEKIKQNAFDELRQLDTGDKVEESEKRKGKSIFEMKFMKDAMARQGHAANREVDDFIKEMGGNPEGGAGSDDDKEEMEDMDPSNGVVAHRAGNRIVYRPATTANQQSSDRPLTSLASDTSSVTLKSTDLLSPPPQSPVHTTRSELSKPPAQESNPWLNHNSEGSRKMAKRSNEVVVSKDSKAVDKSKNKLKKAIQKRADDKEKAADDATVEISLDAVMTTSSVSASASTSAAAASGSKVTAAGQKAASTTGKNPVSQSAGDSEDSDVDLEIEAQEQALALKGKAKENANGIKAFEQRDLVALAFAGDNVVQTFEDAKKREIAADAPREVDTTIPGWGSWGGEGTKKAPPKPQRIKKIAGIDPKTRADYNKKNVIISEKRDKKASKYLVKDLPYPYTSKAQFEKAMERPLGAEWNTRVAFQRGTLPKVVKKPGILIDPLEKLHS